MAKHKVDVVVNGVFTTVDVYLEGNEIPLVKSGDKWSKSFKELDINGDLNLHGLLKGWPGMKWSVSVKVDGKEVYSQSNNFDMPSYVTFSEDIPV